MLAGIRKALSSWVVVLLLSLLVAAFIITSVNDPFGSAGGSNATLVKVGDRKVNAGDFMQQFDRIFRMQQRERPEITREAVLKAGADTEVLALLVTTAGFDAFAEKIGVTAGAENISRAIRSNPAFQLGGQFDVTRYQEVLSQNNMSREQFQALLGSELAREQFTKALTLNPVVPDDLSRTYVTLLQETRTGTVAVVPAERYAAGVGTPDDKTLQAFYEKNIKAYTVPEQRTFRYVLLTPAVIEPGISVSDEDVRQYYEDNADIYAGAEKRTLEQLLLTDEQAARQAYERIAKGEDFLAVARSAGFAAGDVALGTLSEAELTKDAGADIARAAFSTPPGKVSAPVKSDLGWLLLRTTAISQQAGKALESVRGEITAKIRAERALDRLYDMSRAMEDELAGGKSLTDLARARKLEVVTAPRVTANGLDSSGQPVPLAPEARQMLGVVFSQKPDDEPSMQELGKDVFYALEVTGVTPAAAQPLATVRPRVVAEWRMVERMKKAEAVARELVAAVKAGKPLADAARATGLPPTSPVKVRRASIMREGAQVPPPIRMLFSVPRGEARALALPTGEGFFVVATEAIETVAGADTAMLEAATRAEISQSANLELATSFAQAVRDHIGVKYNHAVIEQVRKQLLGSGQE